MSYKGRFKPKQYKKYKGDPTKVIYRSMWELRFMKYCDKTPNILEWSSEEIIIPYRGLDRKVHRYFPDFWIKYKNAKGQIVKVANIVFLLLLQILARFTFLLTLRRV